LVKFEGILFAAVIAGYFLVAIKNIVNEVHPFCRWQSARPCHATNRAKTGKCHARAEIPGLIFRRNA
jgi:hypothetical protein